VKHAAFHGAAPCTVLASYTPLSTASYTRWRYCWACSLPQPPEPALVVALQQLQGTAAVSVAEEQVRESQVR
jgi:hypothetical protein